MLLAFAQGRSAVCDAEPRAILANRKFLRSPRRYRDCSGILMSFILEKRTWNGTLWFLFS